MDEAGWAALEEMPGVIVHRRDPAWAGWSFESDIHVRPGYDVSKIIDQDEDFGDPA